jgi:hypothetical protein
MEIVIEGLGAALDELKQEINDLSLVIGGIDAKLDAAHTMLSHLADAQAAQGVQLNAIMAALYAHK